MTVFADYLTVSDPASAEMKVKGSRFIGVVMPCVSESDIKRNLEHVSSEYPDATHYCYAAVYGGTLRTEKSSDNGEPSGTAAKPILSVIRGNSLTDTMVVVVRYFGGMLLGTGGLVHAYTQSATDALKCASIVKKQACLLFGITLDYSDLNNFNSKCRPLCAVPPEYAYSDKVTVSAAVAKDGAEAFLLKISEVTERRAKTVPLGEGYR